MNILILSCGTRNKLVRCFKENKEINKVVVTDCSELAPAFAEADKSYIVPRMTAPDYFDAILAICKKEKIDIVLPLQEDELLVSSKNCEKYAEVGTSVLVSDYEKVCLCRDKYKLNNYLKDKGISAVETKLASEITEDRFSKPMFIKPRFGAGSVDTMKVSTFKLLDAIRDAADEDMICQPYIKGKEYGVDVYVDFVNGDIISCFIKEKLRMRAGETEKSVSVRCEEIRKLVIDTVKVLGLTGPIDIDILEEYEKFYVLEVNPRFGGGYPHAYECGIDFTKYIVNNSKGISNEMTELSYEEGIIALKYSDVVIKRN